MGKFFTYRQNNSGGSFEVDDKVDVYVIIEAESAVQANSIADDIGIYFDGCEKGLDCECCGDRWAEVDESDGREVPMIYSYPVSEYQSYVLRRTAKVHYLDGRIEIVQLKAVGEE